mmetsp:Transcript_39863/g.55383  ORF Transcript_39863/g.55383 Transcript_39863/m.55383 type:complete len:498 (+) Transcript_39863:146-1639(+)|eukprot:CAMPEP_0196584606 /NCGR_PEP_ID=MMETSP1081-20130531/47719_1 /TAXON_ID=36882 /ORGANISM="Pyramimonas amylifera, Strain CCMP720" /LENGTH=497 /DNA_ID=CAMNT_0041905867 /DNA_START=115 /DNA_END=1608 /DNA_ORIENTATION=-
MNRVLHKPALSACTREWKTFLSAKRIPSYRHSHSNADNVVDVQCISAEKRDESYSVDNRKNVAVDSRDIFKQNVPAAISPYEQKGKGQQPTKLRMNSLGLGVPPGSPSPSRKKGSVGALNRVPAIPLASELVVSALRRASRVGPTKGLKNEAAKARNIAAKQLDALTKELTVPMGRWLTGFPRTEALHPFEQALLLLTLGEGRYEKTILRVDNLRKRLLEIGKSYAGRAAKAATKYDTFQIRDAGFAEMETVYKKDAEAVSKLKEVARELKRLPVVEPEVPTLVLVGAPNVGKSSLVRMLSSGQPEVQNYPFTTRGIQLGHFFVQGQRHIVTDTPGLLNREEEDRNAMERLTLASMKYLPTSVLFVTDLTGLCGTSAQAQLAIRKTLKEMFPDRPWVDVLSKGDLLPIASRPLVAAPSSTPLETEGNLPTQELVAPPAGSVTFIQDEGALDRAVKEAEEHIPEALRVSIVTEEGLGQLKSSILQMLQTDIEDFALHD